MTFLTRIAGAVALGAALLVGVGLSIPTARAGYIVTLTQQGSNVIASGSGALDVTGITFQPPGIPPFSRAFIDPGTSGSGAPVIVIGTGAMIDLSNLTPTNGPSNFGPGSGGLANFSQGDYVEFFFFRTLGGAQIAVPFRYRSGSPLQSRSVYLNTTFNTLGVTPGTYEWTWGSGLNQNFALEIGSTSLPPFAGTPGQPNCSGQSVSALAQQFGGTSNAAAALGFSSVSGLQSAIRTFCATGFIASSAAQRSSVLEPSSLLLLGGALAGLLLMRGRRRSVDAG